MEKSVGNFLKNTDLFGLVEACTKDLEVTNINTCALAMKAEVCRTNVSSQSAFVLVSCFIIDSNKFPLVIQMRP